MRLTTTIIAALAMTFTTQAEDNPSTTLRAGKAGKHLFILAGQSNMDLLNPKYTFTPMVEKEFGKDNVLVVKDAQGGRPIGYWCKNYKYPKGFQTRRGMAKEFGVLYDRLMKKVKEAVGDKEYDTVTFCWMQGESDTSAVLVDLYEEAFKGILSQLKKDLGKEEIYFVIGRLSDWGLHQGEEKKKRWIQMREIQVKIAEEDKNGQWIDTDDCNEGINKAKREIKNDLHMSVEGYKKMGERFAEKAIALIKGTAKEEKK